MAFSTSHKHFTSMFAQWYLWMEPVRIVRGYLAYGRALLEIIPFGFLLLTILQPWKNIQEHKTEHGFNLEKFIERLALNGLSRAVGLVVRLITVALGIVAHALLFAFAVVYFAVWLLFPALIVVGTAFLLKSLL